MATGGFLGIGSAAPGGGQYLLKPNGKTTCGTGGTEATTVKMGQTINNDTLSCFFISPTTHVSDVDYGGYSGTPLISNSIYDSPRFAYVPVLKVQPANGGSKKYQIIDFRACFITDQPGSAVKGDQPSVGNGLTTDNNGIVSVQVIFLNPERAAEPAREERNDQLHRLGSQDSAARQLRRTGFRPQTRMNNPPSTDGGFFMSGCEHAPARCSHDLDDGPGVRTPPRARPLRRAGGGPPSDRPGMIVLDRNWRCEAGEIDLVLRDGDVLVVCEVKTRSSDVCGTPHEAVDAAKLDRLKRLGVLWAEDHGVRPAEMRIDLVAVHPRQRGSALVEHVPGLL